MTTSDHPQKEPTMTITTLEQPITWLNVEQIIEDRRAALASPEGLADRRTRSDALAAACVDDARHAVFGKLSRAQMDTALAPLNHLRPTDKEADRHQANAKATANCDQLVRDWFYDNLGPADENAIYADEAIHSATQVRQTYIAVVHSAARQLPLMQGPVFVAKVHGLLNEMTDAITDEESTSRIERQLGRMNVPTPALKEVRVTAPSKRNPRK
jgi:hypothetical protein